MFSLISNILKNAFSRPATRPYPFQRRQRPEGTRGHLDIEIDKCIFCGICAKKCPSNAIEVSRDPKNWKFNRYACIVCAYCVEACPKKCLSMKPDHEGCIKPQEETAGTR